MTFKEFLDYLSRHSGYSFQKTRFNDDYVMRFAEDFKGYITEENGKFYLLAVHDESGAPIAKNRCIVCTHLLSYRVNRYYIGSIYELSLQQDKATY